MQVYKTMVFLFVTSKYFVPLRCFQHLDKLLEVTLKAVLQPNFYLSILEQ
jgi:hypothetical protein